MRRSRFWSVIIGLWLVLAVSVEAQSGSVRIEDLDNVLGANAAQVRTAAEQLAGQGAQVVVITAGQSAGTTDQSADRYLDTFLSQNNIASSRTNLNNPNQIIFFVARDARRTALLYGSRWRQTLDPVERTIQAEQMNPRFAEGDLAGGLVSGIEAVRTTIDPPTPTAVYVIGGVLAATAAGAVAVPMLRKRRTAAETLAGARERMEQARRSAGVAIADLGQLVKQAQAKAEYDRISYSQTDIERLSTTQAKGLQLFQEAQSAFDAAEEQQNAKATLSVSDYEAIAAQYVQAQQRTGQAATLIRETEALRATLDAQGKPSTDPTTRLHE